MAWLRRFGMAVGVAACIQACYAFSDFGGLDDGAAGNASSSQGSTGAGEAGSDASSGGNGTAGQGGTAGAAGSTGGAGGEPMCKLAIQPCQNEGECCGELLCATTYDSPQQTLCCGDREQPCNTPGGADCCGLLWCDYNVTHMNQKICCAKAGQPCLTPGVGSDCCGSLDCNAGTCG